MAFTFADFYFTGGYIAAASIKSAHAQARTETPEQTENNSKKGIGHCRQGYRANKNFAVVNLEF